MTHGCGSFPVLSLHASVIPWAGPSMTDTVVSITNCNKCLQLKQAMLSSLLLLNEINILDVSLSRHSYTCRERCGVEDWPLVSDTGWFHTSAMNLIQFKHKGKLSSRFEMKPCQITCLKSLRRASVTGISYYGWSYDWSADLRTVHDFNTCFSFQLSFYINGLYAYIKGRVGNVFNKHLYTGWNSSYHERNQ